MPDSTEVPLKEWAAAKNVPLRTAQEWRKNGKIAARRVKTKRQVVVTRTVPEYVVRLDVNPPDDAS